MRFGPGVGGVKGGREGKGAIDRGGEEEDDQPPAFLYAELRKGLNSQGQKARAAREMLDCRPSWRGMERPE